MHVTAVNVVKVNLISFVHIGPGLYGGLSLMKYYVSESSTTPVYLKS